MDSDNRKNFLPLQPFVIPLHGLAQGGAQFEWRAGAEFFGNFDNSEILDADLDVRVSAGRKSGHLDIDCSIGGQVCVLCDRCAERLLLPVATGFALGVGFGNGDVPGEEDGREVLTLPEGEAELDLGQFVYDYVCISLPMRRVHPEGGCNPEALKYLKVGDNAGEAALSDSPFAGLKNMLE